MKNPKIKRRDRRNWTTLIRRTVQAAFVIFIIAASIRHNLLEESEVTASIDALCPLGGLETLGNMLLTDNFTPKTHPSNIVLGIGLLRRYRFLFYDPGANMPVHDRTRLKYSCPRPGWTASRT